MEELTTTIAFSKDVRGGTEPAGATVTLRVDPSGFHDAGGLGAGRQIEDPLAVGRVARLLQSEFNVAELRSILRYLVALEHALPA
jgi:hypothetical protein